MCKRHTVQGSWKHISSVAEIKALPKSFMLQSQNPLTTTTLSTPRLSTTSAHSPWRTVPQLSPRLQNLRLVEISQCPWVACSKTDRKYLIPARVSTELSSLARRLHTKDHQAEYLIEHMHDMLDNKAGQFSIINVPCCRRSHCCRPLPARHRSPRRGYE